MFPVAEVHVGWVTIICGAEGSAFTVTNTESVLKHPFVPKPVTV